jgi:uncharacterized protein (TIGR03437 family)
MALVCLGLFAQRVCAQTPTINAGGIVSGATFAPGIGVAPGSIASAFGSNFGSSTTGATLRLNGLVAPLFFVSPTQINFQVPWELTGQSEASVTATVRGVTSSPVTLPLATYSPGIFVVNSSGQGAVLIANTASIAAPAGAFQGSQAAVPGGLISIFCTGLGPVTNQPATDVLASNTSVTTAIPTVTIGGIQSTPSYSGLAPGFLGLYQVNVQVPSNVSTGNAVPLFLSIGEQQSNTVTIAVGNSGLNMSLSDPIIPAGQSATLTWSSTSAISCSASDGWSGSRPTSGTQRVTPAAAGYYTYTLTCTGSGDTSSQSVVLTAYGPTPSVVEPANETGHQASFYVAPPNQIAGLQTSLTVPPFPPIPSAAGAALFLWPGLDPATISVNFLPINNGVLQPVLSWGPSCAPTSQPKPFSSWWISAQYVNVFGDDPGYTGCFSGNSMLVNPGDVLLIDMALDATTSVWKQTVTDSNTNQSVTFSINMQGQGQNWAYFAMEAWYGATINVPVTFSNTLITFQSADTTGWCSISQGENNAYIMTPPTPQNSGTQCFISSIVLTQ